jgi:hypothetical protein
MKSLKPAPPLIGENPLSPDAILERFYRPHAPRPDDEPTRKTKPAHYKVVCISLYNEDIELLESLVAELKRRGHTKANKSQLIRAALAQVDLAKVPRLS